MADELNKDDKELIRAANNPQTTMPVIPFGNNWATIDANAESLL